MGGWRDERDGVFFGEVLDEVVGHGETREGGAENDNVF